MDAKQHDTAVRLAIGGLLGDYAACIDADELERWPDFFTENAVYQITTAYNHARGLPIGIVYANNRRMLEDRVAALRKANIYEPQRYRHIVSAIRVVGGDGGLVRAETSFLVVRTTVDGSQHLFATGRYLDRVDFSAGEPRFAEKLVVLDSDKVDTLLAVPL